MVNLIYNYNSITSNSNHTQSDPERGKPSFTLVNLVCYFKKGRFKKKEGEWRGGGSETPTTPHPKPSGPPLYLVECCFTSTETVGLFGTGAQD